MEYRVDTGGGSNREVHIRGRMTFADSNAFHQLVNQMGQEAAQRWVFNLGSLEFIDSSGMGMILMARDVLTRGGGTLVLRQPGGQVRKSLDMAKFEELVVIEA